VVKEGKRFCREGKGKVASGGKGGEGVLQGFCRYKSTKEQQQGAPAATLTHQYS
jgi:hypothetical protein